MSFSGTGELVYGNEIIRNVHFNVNIDFDNIELKDKGKIVVELNNNYLLTKLNNLPFFPWDLSGKTTDGRIIISSNMALISRSESIEDNYCIKLGFSFDELIIGNRTNFSKVEFFVPNLLIGFNEYETKGKLDFLNISNMCIVYNEQEFIIELHGMNDVSINKNKIIVNNNDIITVKVVIKKKESNISYDEANKVADMLFDLISIAYGDNVNWRYWIGYVQDSEELRVIRNARFAKIKPFRQLIRVEYPFSLTSYINNSFSKYSKMDDNGRHIYRRFIDGIRFSADRLVFPEPFISLGGTIEEFAYENLDDLDTHYINKSNRNNLIPNFKLFIEENIIPILNEDDISDFDDNGIKQKLSGLMQRNLRTRIIALLKFYNIEYNDSHIRDFVRKRNDAAHGTYKFCKENDYMIWTRMASYLEQIALKIIDYNGEYLDWSVSPPQWKIMQKQ